MCMCACMKVYGNIHLHIHVFVCVFVYVLHKISNHSGCIYVETGVVSEEHR